MRTIIWAFICTLVAMMAVHGLDISSRHSALQEVPANSHIQPGRGDNDSNDPGGMELP